MRRDRLMKYAILSIFGVFILFVIPFFILHSEFDISLLSKDKLLSDQSFLVAVKNTILFMIIFIPIEVMLGFTLAYMTERFKFPLVVQIIIILPIFLPALSVSGFFKEILYAKYFEYLGSIGFLGTIFLWAGTGYTYLIMLISLKSRDVAIEQAAMLDGSGSVRTLFQIILPTHINAFVLSIILSIYNSLRIFKYTYAVFGEIPPKDLLTIQNYLYIKLKKFHPDVLVMSADLFLIIILIMLLAVLSWGNYKNKKMLR